MSGLPSGEDQVVVNTRIVRIAMIVAIVLVLAGGVIGAVGGAWPAAAAAFAMLPLCSLVLLFTYQGRAYRRPSRR
jgi:hypothetical protein